MSPGGASFYGFWVFLVVIHRNHSFGFSFAETNWVSVSTETRFEFRSTETLTETHILGNFSLLKTSENFEYNFTQKLLENIEKSLVICVVTQCSRRQYDI